MIRPIWSPTVSGIAHQPSAQERMPRSSHIRANSASRSATWRGIGPSEWLSQVRRVREDRELGAVVEEVAHAPESAGDGRSGRRPRRDLLETYSPPRRGGWSRLAPAPMRVQFDRFYTYAELTETLEAWAAEHPGLSAFESIGTPTRAATSGSARSRTSRRGRRGEARRVRPRPDPRDGVHGHDCRAEPPRSPPARTATTSA